VSVTIHICITIAASPDDVWRSVERIETHTEWMLDAETITFRSEQHSGVGAQFDCLTRVGPLHTTDRFVITKWEPGAVMGIEHRGAVTGVGEFRLRPLAGGVGRSRSRFRGGWAVRPASDSDVPCSNGSGKATSND
jgi:uncharacterized protein YndB with AHSA1/START domain